MPLKVEFNSKAVRKAKRWILPLRAVRRPKDPETRWKRVSLSLKAYCGLIVPYQLPLATKPLFDVASFTKATHCTGFSWDWRFRNL